jgi:hypothetical protein
MPEKSLHGCIIATTQMFGLVRKQMEPCNYGLILMKSGSLTQLLVKIFVSHD